MDDELTKISRVIRDPAQSKESRELLSGIFDEAAAEAERLIHPVVHKELKREQMRCKAELSSWGDLANLIEKQNFFVTGQPAKDAPPPLTEISLFTLQMYLRAGLRDYPHWEALRGSVEHWQ